MLILSLFLLNGRKMANKEKSSKLITKISNFKVLYRFVSQATFTFAFFLNLPKVPVAACQVPLVVESPGHFAAEFSTVAKNKSFFPPRSAANLHCFLDESKYKYIGSVF